MLQVETEILPKPSLIRNGSKVNLSSIVYVITVIFLSYETLQGALRYGLSLFHLAPLSYLPVLFMLIAVVLFPLIQGHTSKPAIITFGLVAIYLIWGLVNLSSPLEAIIGLWIFVPLIYGIWAGPYIDIIRWRRVFTWLFIVAASGVLFNPLVHYPWIGSSIIIFGQKIRVSWDWYDFSAQRYPGFARTAINAANQLLLYAIVLMFLTKNRIRKLLIWLIAGVGIALTTIKGALGSWILLSIYFTGGSLLKWPKYWIRLWLILMALTLLSMILLPLSTLWIHYNLGLRGFVSKFLFVSFGARLNYMWPHSLHLLDLGGHWHWMVGRGLGGIGTPQMFFDPANYYAGDNEFVAIAVMFGLPVTVVLFFMLFWRFVKVSTIGCREYLLPLLLFIIAYSVVINLDGEPILNFMLGVTISRIYLSCKYRYQF